MLPVEKIRPLTTPSAVHSSLAIAADWLLIIGNFALAAAIPHPAVWTISFLISARQQLALAIVMHDGAHRRLFPSAKINDYVCQYFCAAPLFFSMYSYQRLHLKHHRDPLAADDPDLSLIGGYPIARRSFARKLLRDATGISYSKFIRYFIHMARKPKASSPAANSARAKESQTPAQTTRMSLPSLIFSMLLMNGLIGGALAATGHAWLYLFLWVLPAVTALQVLLRIRGVAEHAGYTAGPDQRLNARTVIHPLQTLIFAPHNVAYHIEHHAYPAVPFYNLPKLHRLMTDADLLPATNVFRGYHKVFADILH